MQETRFSGSPRCAPAVQQAGAAGWPPGGVTTRGSMPETKARPTLVAHGRQQPNADPLGGRISTVIRHPYETLDARTLATATLGLAAFTILLTAILAHEVPSEVRREVARLLGAESGAPAAAVLAAWDREVYQAFSFMLGFDFLYDIVHNNAVALASPGFRSSRWVRNGA